MDGVKQEEGQEELDETGAVIPNRRVRSMKGMITWGGGGGG